MPAHNAERYIEEALDSVIRQSWPTLEIIVVDDGSTDATASIVEELGDGRVTLVRQESRGASAARNAGMRDSHGAFIQYLDADDVLSVNKLALQLDAIRHAGDRTIASCAWAHFENSAATAHIRSEPLWTENDPHEWLVRSFSGEGMMQPAAWLTPRALIDAAGPWDETLSLHDDGEFFLRVLSLAQEIAFVPGSTVFYRSVATSLSRRRSPKAIDSAFKVCRARDRVLLASRDDPAARRAIATQYGQFAYEFREASPELADRALLRIAELGEEPAPIIGGRWFQAAASVVGFKAALKARSLARSSRAR